MKKVHHIIYNGDHIDVKVVVEDVRNINYRLKKDITRKTDIFGYEHDDDYIRLTRYGHLTGKAGYGWDGATGAIDSAYTLIASCYHDIGYQLIRIGVLPYRYKALFDRMLRDTMLDQAPENFGRRQVAQVRAWGWYIAVTVAGRWAGKLNGR